MKFNCKLLLVFIALLLCGSCTSDGNDSGGHHHHHHADSKSSESNDKPLATLPQGTRQMVDSLNAVYNRIDFNNHPYEFERQLERLQAQLKDKKDPGLLMQYAFVNLQSGKSEAALEILEELLAKYKFPLQGEYKRFYDLLAISCLRMAEQVNCIKNHVASSCIVPIAEEAIHKDKTYSNKAIEYYTKILRSYPEDYQSRWLLNIAYMTIGEHPAGVPPEYLIELEVGSTIPRFTNIAGEVSLDINSLAGGSIAEDFNNDGLVDLAISSWGLKDQMRLFFNNGSGTFVEKTNSAGLTGITGGLNMIQADYNNDGNIDILVLRGAWNGSLERGVQPNSLLKNNGDGTFEDVTIAAGIFTIRPTQAAVWADFNVDGHLDLFVVNESNRAKSKYKQEFYRNNGDGTFTDITEPLAMGFDGVSKGVAVGDINNDRLPDLYISFIDQVNFTLINNSKSPGEFSFRSISESCGALFPLQSFPCWFFDYDNDGWDDLFVSSYDETAFGNQAGEVALSYLNKPFKSEVLRLYRNNGNETFEDITQKVGLNLPVHTMGCNYGDLNNDGYLDFYLGTGAPDYRSIVPNRMFLNKSGQTFEDVTFSGGFGHIQKGHGVSFADFDNDGDQDIYAVMGGSVSGDKFQNVLFENPIESANWIKVKLVGSSANKSALGAKIKVVIRENGATRDIYKTVSSGGSFGANTLTQTIGLGQASEIVSLTIYWPDAQKNITELKSLKPNRFYRIDQATQKVEDLELAKTPLVKSASSHHHHH